MSKLNLLLPMDTTDFDQTLIDEVTELFQPKLFNLSILHVTAIPDMTLQDYDDLLKNNETSSNDDTAKYNSQAQQFEQYLLEELDSSKDGFETKGFEVSCNIAFGEAAKEILKFAETQDINLIIMSKHNRKSLPRLNMGSVTTTVLEKATVPVLLLRPNSLGQEKS